MWDCQEQATLSLMSLYRKKRGSSDVLCSHHNLETLCSCVPGNESLHDITAPKSTEKIPTLLLWDCTSLKCGTEPDGMLQMGPTMEFLEQSSPHTVPLPWRIPTTHHGLGLRSCKYYLEPWEHITRKPLWPPGLHHVVFCRKCLYLFQREVLLFQIKCLCHLLKEW